MTDTTALKQRVYAAIDARRAEIVALGEDIRLHPELGFKEQRTSALVQEQFARLGLAYQAGLAITGVKTRLPGSQHRASICFLGELDSVLVRDHPDADPLTGAAHACGHNAQIANVIALAMGLVESGVMAELAGDVVLMAVPAEEYVEVEYRVGLKAQGDIEFLGGKPELIRLGAFDDVDMTFSTHQSSGERDGVLGVGGASNGCVVKQIAYTGRASHAGGAPHSGVNALRAAMIGLQAIDANRETFKDDDHIRVHPIITKGGELVNVIPADVRLETYVRGASTEAIVAAAAKVDRSLVAGAMALGAQVDIRTLPGYMPTRPCDALGQVYKVNALQLISAEDWSDPSFMAGSTDMGDVSHIMPTIETRAGGASGAGHGADYAIADPEVAYILPAKAAAGTIIDLLVDGACRAREIIAAFEAPMTKEEYLAFLRSQDRLEHWQPSA
jgi:amidohydrolase